MSAVEVFEPTLSVCEFGLAKFAWWQDWRGRAVAIVASGPSTKKEDVELLRGRLPVIAIKENVDLCPWADVVYGCDAAWWKNKRGLVGYAGVKVSYTKSLKAQFPDINLIDVQKDVDRFLFAAPGVLGSGGNSGFQAVNLAAQFGADRILGIGFDMSDRSGLHWFGRSVGPGRNNPTEDNFIRWRRAFDTAAYDLETRGIEFVVASQASALRRYRKQSVEQTLAEWHL